MCRFSRKSSPVTYPEHLPLYINDASFRSFKKECVSTDRYCYCTAQLDYLSLRGGGGGLKNGSRAPTSKNPTLLRANILKMHKVSRPFIINGAAPGCTSEVHHRRNVCLSPPLPPPKNLNFGQSALRETQTHGRLVSLALLQFLFFFSFFFYMPQFF